MMNEQAVESDLIRCTDEVNNAGCEEILLDMLRKIKEGFDDWAAAGKVRANPVTEQYVRMALEIVRELRANRHVDDVERAMDELKRGLDDLSD